MKQIIFFLLVVTILLSNGCANNNLPSANNQPNSTETPEKSTLIVADLTTDPPEIRAGEETELLIEIKTGTGEIIKDFDVSNEKPLHLLIVSEDLKEFYHLHPEQRPDGKFKTSFKFENGGNYKFFTDFKIKGESPEYRAIPRHIAGNERPKEELKPDEKPEKTIDGLRVVLNHDEDLVSNKDLLLNFAVIDAKTGNPVTDLEKYLGESAHFVVVSQDLRHFVHAHPVSKDNVKSAEHSEHSHESGNEQNSDTKLMNPEGLSVISALVNFPTDGIYKIWAQFQRNGKVITVPFVVEVKENAEEKALDLSNVKFPEGSFKIIVSREGFIPNEITFRQGQPLKLAFYRVDEINCGDEVVFKDLNIRKKLPVGQIVLVDIPTDKPGEFNFACGMDMLKGKIVVQ